MRYGRPNIGRGATGMGVQGVVPPSALTAVPQRILLPESEVVGAQGQAQSEASVLPKPGLVRGLMQNPSDGWPIPRKRFEFSVILVGELGAVLLIAPVYLIFDRLHGLKHTPGFAALCSLGAHLMQTTELGLGLATMLLIPILPKRFRGVLMQVVGLAIILNLLILLGRQESILMLMVAYPLVSLLSLVMLDAVTGIRPAAPQSPRLAGWQLMCGSAVTALWVIPLIISSTCKVFPSLFSQTHLILIRTLLMTATLGATVSGLCALHGYFRGFTRRINLVGRLTGSLALAIAMGLGLWGSMVGTGLIKHQDKWLRLEMLWIFLLISGALMLCWGGMTQRLINAAARERETPSDDAAETAEGDK